MTSATTVADAMIRAPKVHPADCTVAELRQFFADDHVHAALLVSGEHLVAVCEREDLEDRHGARVADDQPAHLLGQLGNRTTYPQADLAKAARFLIATRRRRVAVIDAAGRLVGLLCLKKSGTGFCSNDDVASRATGRSTNVGMTSPPQTQLRVGATPPSADNPQSTGSPPGNVSGHDS